MTIVLHIYTLHDTYVHFTHFHVFLFPSLVLWSVCSSVFCQQKFVYQCRQSEDGPDTEDLLVRRDLFAIWSLSKVALSLHCIVHPLSSSLVYMLYLSAPGDNTEVWLLICLCGTIHYQLLFEPTVDALYIITPS